MNPNWQQTAKLILQTNPTSTAQKAPSFQLSKTVSQVHAERLQLLAALKGAIH